MISANVCFSWNNNSDTACNNSARSVKVARRYLLNALSARLNRFSISASSKGENSFSFSPVAGLIEAIAIIVPYIAVEATKIGKEGSPSRGSATHPAVAPYHTALDSQSFWNENAIEQIKTPLHEEREHSSGNRTLENRHVIAQVETAYDRFA